MDGVEERFQNENNISNNKDQLIEIEKNNNCCEYNNNFNNTENNIYF